MIHGIGIDLASRSRFEALVGAGGERFQRRWFTPAERLACEAAVPTAAAYAATFAGKEAVWKALGLSGGGPVPWGSIEVLGDPRSGTGTAVLADDLPGRATLPALRITVTWTSTREAVLAVAIAESIATPSPGVRPDSGSAACCGIPYSGGVRG